MAGTQQNVLLIGFGNMGQALARGWLARGHSAAAIRAVDPADGAHAAATELGIAAAPSVEAALRADSGAAPDVVVVAVKPNLVTAALADYAPHAAGGRAAVCLSIAAGKTLAQLAAALGGTAPVVRAMPNTPAAIGRGMTALVANTATTAAQRAVCADLMSAVGAVAWLADERDMDAVTALSGSGPAYVFLLIECLEQAGRELGLPDGLAAQLALETVAGAGAYAAAAGQPPALLRARVTSPGGTTQAALDVLRGAHGLPELVSRAVQAAAVRSRELARG